MKGKELKKSLVKIAGISYNIGVARQETTTNNKEGKNMKTRYERLDELFLRIVYNDKLYDNYPDAWKNQCKMIESLKIRYIVRIGMEREE